jgi:hypothetical protein
MRLCRIIYDTTEMKVQAIVTYHYLYIATQEQEYQSRPRSVSFDITNGRRVTNVGCDLMRAGKNTTE